LPKGARDLKWSPDGKSIVFTSSSNPETSQNKRGRKRKRRKRSVRRWGRTHWAFRLTRRRKQRNGRGGARERLHVITRPVYIVATTKVISIRNGLSTSGLSRLRRARTKKSSTPADPRPL
jgi:hypothetical protein